MASKISQTAATILAALSVTSLTTAPVVANDRLPVAGSTPALIAPMRSTITVHAADYAIDLPNHWKDRVNITVDHDTIIVTSRKYPDREIATINLAENNRGTVLVDDLAYSLVATMPVDGGRHVEIWAPRWTYLHLMGESDLTDGELTELADLQTGDSHVDLSDEGLFAMDDWLRGNLTLAA